MSPQVSLESLVEALRAIPAAEFTDTRVAEVVGDNRLAPAALEPFLVWRPERYTRNLVYRDRLFQVLVLCWNVGQCTPVHDHAGQRCWMRVERGRLEVTSYGWRRSGGLELIGTQVVGRGEQEAQVDHCASVHHIANRAAWGEPAVSLHVYSRPFDRCHIYDLASGTRQQVVLGCDRVGPLVEGARA